MKKNESSETNDDLRTEYDFRGAVRERHYKPLHEGYTVEIHKPDGTMIVEQHTLAEGTVWLEPDVRTWFPDSASVNQALRSLITLLKQVPDKHQQPQQPQETAKAG